MKIRKTFLCLGLILILFLLLIIVVLFNANKNMAYADISKPYKIEFDYNYEDGQNLITEESVFKTNELLFDEYNSGEIEFQIYGDKYLSNMRESCLKGNAAGIQPILGYTIVNKKYQIVEAEAIIVRKLFDDYVNGSAIKDLVEKKLDNILSDVLNYLQAHNVPRTYIPDDWQAFVREILKP